MKALKAATLILAISHVASAALASETKPAVSCDNRRDSGTAVAPALPAGGSTATRDDTKAWQRQAAWRKRRIIMNNDGNDCFGLTTDPKNIHQEFLRTRTSPLAGSQVDSIFYCTGVFNSYSHDSRESELQSCGDKGVPSCASDLIKAGRDSLITIVEFGHGQKWEVFWSMRMNDTHDASDGTLLSRWKQTHPHCLMGSRGAKFPYGGWDRWSALNYDLEEVRDKVFRICMDVSNRYDVDGIELDFFRHPIYFKAQMLGEPVTQQQCDKITALLSRVRRGTQEAARRRDRPLLIAVRVMDSPGYARGIGLDVAAWLKDGLIDVLIVGGCYFHLEPWQTMVRMGHQHDVPVYACLSASRLQEDVKLWRGEAMDAWKAGVDGIYTFNLFDPRHTLFRELGDPARLQNLPAENRYTMGSKYWIDFLKNGESYRRIEPDRFQPRTPTSP